ncbi:MAG: ABC transporter permease, partial [Microthrixaceae bacterium]
MDKFLIFTIAGLSTAAIYAIAASGLVVTYTTSGIFNFAHGAFSMMAAFMYWQVHMGWGVPALPAFLLVVFVIGPLFGAIVERGIMRGIEGASDVVKIVVTISLMIALIGISMVIWKPDVARPVPAFFAGRKVEIFNTVVNYQRLMAMAIAIAVAIGLRLIFKTTRLGIAMRAVVDDRSLLQLNGGRPSRTSMMAWALGSGMAALSGVLIASEQTLSGTTLTLLFINAYAVAVVGRLRSLPGAFLGAVILGLLESYAIGYIPQDAMLGPISLQSSKNAIPAVMLFVVIMLQPQDRLRAHGVSRRSAGSQPVAQRVALVGGVAFVLVVAAIGSLMSLTDLNLVTTGFYLAIVTLSLVPLTGYAGQISLAQLTFTGIGAVAMATWGANGSLLGVGIAVGVCALVGAIVAFPALRLSGIYLALATAAFALFCSAMFFNQVDVMPGGNRQVPRLNIGPLAINSDFRQLVLLAVVFAAIGNLLVLLRRSAWGRRLTAMKDSPVACATLGLNLTSTKVGVFALSAAIAGGAGAISGRTFLADTLTLPGSLSVTMLAVVGGIGSVAGAFFGGMLLGAFPIGATIFAANAIGIFGFVAVSVKDILVFSPGMMGVSLGRDPDGAAPQLALGYRSVGRSVPALVTTAIGVAAIWVLARFDSIGNWSFFAAEMLFVFGVVPLLPLFFAPVQVQGRRIATAIWLTLGVVTAAVIPWDSVISSTGMRVVAIFVFMFLITRTAIGIFGVNPLEQDDSERVDSPSPDMFGIHQPLTKADALDAERALGLHEELQVLTASDSDSLMGSSPSRRAL